MFQREVTLEAADTSTSVRTVSVVGRLLQCDDSHLQLFINTASVTSTDTGSQEMEMKRCRVALAETALCRFECDCPVEAGGCQDGLLWQSQRSVTSSQICEIMLA